MLVGEASRSFERVFHHKNIRRQPMHKPKSDGANPLAIKGTDLGSVSAVKIVSTVSFDRNVLSASVSILRFRWLHVTLLHCLVEHITISVVHLARCFSLRCCIWFRFSVGYVTMICFLFSNAVFYVASRFCVRYVYSCYHHLFTFSDHVFLFSQACYVFS